MSLDLPLPKQVLGHGWLLIDGSKMSKSQAMIAEVRQQFKEIILPFLSFFQRLFRIRHKDHRTNKTDNANSDNGNIEVSG